MSSLTLQWLKQKTIAYSHKDTLYSHFLPVLSAFPTLRPKSDVYTFDDGRTQLLLCLHGLLPISFRHVAYNIPIAIWFPLEYPKQPPIVYVVPTNDMLVKPGKFIDVSGKCSIDYLQLWLRKDEGCNLIALLQSLQDHFSRDPPVYSKPKDPVYPARPPPPLSSRVSSSSPPLPPPRPDSARIHPSLLETAPPPPPRPPHPPISGLHHPSIGSASQIPAPLPVFSPVQSPLPPLPPPPPPPQPLHHVVPPPPPPPPPQFTHYQQYNAPHQPSIPDLLGQDDDSASLSQSSFPPAPPRPPNPELLRLQTEVHHKLTSELNSLSQAFKLDAERLRAHQADLLAGEPAIKDEMARLEAVRDVCRNVANRTRQAVQRADSNIAEIRRKGDPEVDELVCATSIVHNQLINLIADDNAIEDTIYHLHRALNSGRIDLERFLRTTRVLAEEQFMKRALIDKVQSSLSAAPSMSAGWT